LTCQYLQFAALVIGPLAIRMIETSSKTLLVEAVGTTPLKESCLAATWLAAVCLSSIAPPANKKDHTAGRTPTDLLAKLVWQYALVFLKAGLDNGRRSWQAMRWANFLFGSRPFSAPSALYAWGFSFSASEKTDYPGWRK
jgi:hypothetical protein